MKSLESVAFIGGFISAHYIKLYIKCLSKPPGSPSLKRRFQIRKTCASNISSFCLRLHCSLLLSPLCLSLRKRLLFFPSRSFCFTFGRKSSVSTGKLIHCNGTQDFVSTSLSCESEARNQNNEPKEAKTLRRGEGGNSP